MQLEVNVWHYSNKPVYNTTAITSSSANLALTANGFFNSSSMGVMRRPWPISGHSSFSPFSSPTTYSHSRFG